MPFSVKKFAFKSNDRENLEACFKQAAPEKVLELINRAEKHINNLLWLRSPGDPRASESKAHLESINKAAASLLCELNKSSTKYVYKIAMAGHYPPEKRKLEKTISLIRELETQSRDARDRINPVTNSNPTNKQLVAWLEESYFFIFEKAHGKGKGTPFDNFKCEIIKIFNVAAK